MIPIYFETLLEFFVIKIGTGWVFSTLYMRLLVVIFFAISLNSIFSFFSKTRKLKMWVTFLIAVAPGIGISMIRPVWQGEYGSVEQLKNLPDLDISGLRNETKGMFSSGKGNQIVAFFTSNCPHCMNCSKKLGINIEAGMTLPVTTFFPGEADDANRFLDKNRGSEFNSYCLSDSTFLNNAGQSFPVTFLIDKDGKTLNYWKGDVVNYNALDYLLDME